MTEVIITNSSDWIFKEGNAGEYLRPAFDAYDKHLADSRYIDAGPLTNDEPISTDKEQLEILEKLQIRSKCDLKCLLTSNGITEYKLAMMQTPYFHDKVDGVWTQVKNPEYAVAINGVTFDNAYAIYNFMEILPEDGLSCVRSREYSAKYDAEVADISNKESLAKAYERVIQDAFQKCIGLRGCSFYMEQIANGKRSVMSGSCLEEKIEFENEILELYFKRTSLKSFVENLTNWKATKTSSNLNF